MRRSVFFWVLAAGWPCLASALEPSPNSIENRLYPNILLYTFDTLRADHTSVGGYSKETTPTLDQIAERGMSFTNAFSTHTHTLPSLIAILTGLNPTLQGAHRLNWEFNEGMELHELDTLPRLLKRAGYKTALFSDHFGIKATIAEHDAWDDKEICEPVPGKLAERCTAWISALPGDLPFFVWVHAFGPHYPYLPGAPYDTRFVETEQAESEFAKWYRKNAARPSSMEQVEALCRKNLHGEREYLISQYDGAIAESDAAFKVVLEQLRVSSGANPWLVAVSADHGESFGERTRFWHGNAPFDHETRVPLLLHGPGLVPVGLRVSQQVSTIDIMPTLLSLASAPLPERSDGLSLLRYLRPDAELENRTLTLAGAYSPSNDSIEIAIRSSRGKLMFHWNLSERTTNMRYLYRENGTHEVDNPIAFSRREYDLIIQVQSEILSRLESKAARSDARPIELDEETTDAMESIGYLKSVSH